MRATISSRGADRTSSNHPSERPRLRADLWPDADSEARAKSLRNCMSELRRALGSENVPTARGTGYSVSASALCDWTQFTQLMKSTQLIGSDETAPFRWYGAG
jgi:DNA-binding SARP family transcriptional activator